MNDPNLIAKSYNNFGVLNRRKGDFQKAKDYFLQSFTLSKEEKDTAALSGVSNNLGLVYENLGNYEEALKYHIFSLREREKLGAQLDIASSLNNIGNLYIAIGDHEKAEEYMNKSLEIKRAVGNKHHIASTLQNLAIVKYHQKKLEEALSYYEESLGIYKSLDDKRNIGSVLSNMAFLAGKNEDYQKALDYNLQSIAILEEIQSLGKLCHAYNSLAATYQTVKNYSSAKTYALKAEALSDEIGDLQSHEYALQILFEIHYSMKDYKNAFEYMHAYTEIKDSLLNESNSERILELETKYETEKKEKEIAQLEIEKAKQALSIERRDNTIYILISVFVLLLVIAYFLFRQYRTEQKHKSLKLEQRLLRSQMNPHFIFNAISGIQNYITNKKPLEASSYLSDFSKLMRSILMSSSTEFVVLEDELNTMDYYMKLQQLRFPDKMAYEIITDESLDTDELMIPPMLIQPFIENAIVHGIAKKEEGKGKIELRLKQKDDTLIVEVSDNGAGLNNTDQKRKKHTSMATDITKGRIENFRRSYKQKVHFEMNNRIKESGEIEGTKVLFELPLRYID